MENSEEQIINACQHGELSRFTELYDRYADRIYKFVYYKTLHKETAEDIVSTVFIKALEHIGAYRNGAGGFQAWLYRIARNAVIDHFRTTRPHRDIEDVWQLADREELDQQVDRRQLLEKVGRYLDTIKPQQREIVLLRVWDGLPYKEIAAIVGKSEANCKMIFSRALQVLQHEFSLLLCLFIINIFTYG